jgi:hypothetical protein
VKKALKQFMRPVRSLLGIEQLLYKQKQLVEQLKTQRHQLDKAMSYLEFVTLDE